jgi:hypothetical protein
MAEEKIIRLVHEPGLFTINYGIEDSSLNVYFLYDKGDESQVFERAKAFAKELSSNLGQKLEGMLK